jgi:hypothetical protein
MAEEINITASETTIDDILSRNHRFQVPSYQRQYSWDEEHWNDLWNDLQSIEDVGTHFLGSIVIISSPYEPSGPNVLQLVDGQQRLATISVVLSVIRELYEESEETDKADLISREYLFEEGFDETYPKIRLGNLDDDYFQQILTGEAEFVDTKQQLRKSYDYFRSKMEELSIDEIDELRKNVLNKLTVVTIRSNTETSAFRLFETLNDRGLELSAIDLMKNFVLREAHENSSINAESIKSSWEHLIANLQTLGKPIRFFRHYMMSAPAPELDNRVTESKAYDTFKQLISDRLSETTHTLESYIGDVEEQSRTYVDIANAEVGLFSPNMNNRINSRLKDLNDIGAIPSRTLLLRAFRETENANSILAIIDMIETYTIRANIARYSTGSGVDALYNQLAVEAFDVTDSLDYLQNQFVRNGPSDDEFTAYFVERNFPQNSQTKYILDTIERRHYMKEGTGKEIADRSQVHIEHIAPLRSYSTKKYSKWRDYLGTTESEFDRYKSRIGNLTLFERKLNIKASDSPFEQKKTYYQNSDFEMTCDLCEIDKWSIDEIDRRSRRLANVANDIWDPTSAEK